jgi:hypothetical protein
MQASWFRNLPGTEPFGRFDPQGGTCETSLDGLALTAADYSLQLAATVTRAISGPASFNPCTWDEANPPSASPPGPAPLAALPAAAPVHVFEVTRDPEDQ